MVTAGAILWVLARHEAVSLHPGERRPREFMAFYTVGRVLNESPSQLYKPEAFLEAYRTLFPSLPADKAPVYAHAPFEGVIFRPFARLPFEQALMAWQALSLGLIGAGFTLVWRSSKSLPRNLLPLALLLAISFQPVSVRLVLVGQVSALGFFWIALAIWCQRRGWERWSGAALSLCLSKPTLLILLLPMLVVGRRWRALGGLLCGAVVLAVASLLVVGWRGGLDYVEMMLQFGEAAMAKQQAFAAPSLYVDLNSFLRMLADGHGQMALAVLTVLAAGVVPCLVRLWRSMPTGGEVGLSLAWASTLTWTMLLNLYVPGYDTPIVILGILLTVDVLCRAGQGRLPLVPQVLFAVLYFAPWSGLVAIGGGARLQPYTVVLIALGTYQVWLAMRVASGTGKDQGRRETVRTPESLAPSRAS